MEYKQKDIGPYKLHFIKTKKFKTISVRVNFRRKITREDITIRNILSDLMTHSTKQYQTKKELVIKTQDLYAVNLTAGSTRLGNFINTSFTLTCLNDKYTEEDNFKNSLELFHEILFNPNIKDDKFNQDSFDIVMENAKTSLQSIKEDSSYYSLIRALENMASDSPISYRMAGYLEDLKDINSKNVYTYYKEMIKKDLIEILVVGDFNIKEMESLIKKYFTFNTFKRDEKVAFLTSPKRQIRKKIIKEKEDNKQSKLVIGCRILPIDNFEKNYALTLYNLILGGGSNAKLFNEVREKSSLVYYINSIPNKLDNTLVIRAGISKENFDKTIKLIEKQLTAMKKGDFDDKDIAKAIEIYKNSLEEIEERPDYIIEAYYLMSLIDLDDIKTRREKISTVKKEDIIKVAKKIKMDTIYLLEGEDS